MLAVAVRVSPTFGAALLLSDSVPAVPPVVMIVTVAVPLTVPVTVEVAVIVKVPVAEPVAVNKPVEEFIEMPVPPLPPQFTVAAGFPVPTTVAVNCCVFVVGVVPRSITTTAGETVTEVTVGPLTFCSNPLTVTETSVAGFAIVTVAFVWSLPSFTALVQVRPLDEIWCVLLTANVNVTTSPAAKEAVPFV